MWPSTEAHHAVTCPPLTHRRPVSSLILPAVKIHRHPVKMVAYANHFWLVSFANVSRDFSENDAKNVRK